MKVGYCNKGSYLNFVRLNGLDKVDIEINLFYIYFCISFVNLCSYSFFIEGEKIIYYMLVSLYYVFIFNFRGIIF